MNTTEIIYLSKKGMKELKKQESRLERDRAQALNELRELDTTDNHEERLARIEKLSVIETIEGKLLDIHSHLSRAKQYPRKRDALIVAIGSVVELIDNQGRMVHYTLVDSIEANPSDGRISVKSPLGQSLLGKRLTDAVEWSTGRRTNHVQLVGIS